MTVTTVVEARAKMKKSTPGADAAAGAGPRAGRVETAPHPPRHRPGRLRSDRRPRQHHLAHDRRTPRESMHAS
ncbi:hypothetical protein [Streptomyces sp. NPDC002540]